MIDAHFHLNYLPQEGIAEALRKAHGVGVLGGIVAGVWNEDTEANVKWSFPKENESPFPFSLFLSHGLHPLVVGERWLDDTGGVLTSVMEADMALFATLLDRHADLIWALGETGFDLSRGAVGSVKVERAGKEALIRLQERAFDFCLDLAERHALPVIVHSRNAWQRTLSHLEPRARRGVRSMIHCFGGSAEELPRLAALGIGVTFGGVATWENSRKVHEAVQRCPDDILMLETDAPDLSPVRPDGSRAERNAPAEIVHVVARVAALRGTTPERIVEISDRNVKRFLGPGTENIQVKIPAFVRRAGASVEPRTGGGV